MKTSFYYIALLILTASCSPSEVSENKARSFVDVAGLDSSIRPGDNFFRYVNGKWYDTVQIADDQVGVGSYHYMNIPQKKRLQEILVEVSAVENEEGSLEQKVGDFYASGLDTATINKRGFEPIKPLLAKVDAISDLQSMRQLMIDELKSGNYSLIAFGISPDKKNSSVNMAHFYQAGTSLPDRDYYFNTDSETLEVQKAYKTLLETLFNLTGTPDARSKAELVYDIEKQLASFHKNRIELRDVDSNFNKMAVEEMDRNQPNIGWKELIGKLGMEIDSIDVAQTAYYKGLNELLVSIPLKDWKVYLKAGVLSTYASILSKEFQDANFAYSRILSGQSVQNPRGEIMATQVNQYLGFDLGQLYVKRYFGEAAKKRVLDLVNNLQKAFEIRISNLDWMSDSTKIKAKEKLNAITKKIGYPDVWREYPIKIDRNRYFENVIALRQNDYRYELEQLGQPPNKEEWHATPSLVTAYYNPTSNEIVFPAAILQYPYFDLYADDAINYGGIGMVIGHELTHAFDDRGAQFDKDGNVKNWWTKEDYSKFREKTQQVIDLYSTFTVLDSIPLRGALTVGENTADNAGIAIAYEAFKMTDQGQDTTRIDGFTPDQRFFYSVARIWRVKTRNEFMRTYIQTNPHSPAIWRVNGPLSSMTPFYNAFDVQPGDKNYLPEDERIRIW